MMAVVGSLQLSQELGICKTHGCNKQFRNLMRSPKLRFLSPNLSSLALRRESSSIQLANNIYRPIHSIPSRLNLFKCSSLLDPGQPFAISTVKNAAVALARSYNALQGSPVVIKLVPAIVIIAFALWGVGPLVRQSRNAFLHKSDSSWKKSNAYYVMASYLQPVLLWTGATLICRALDPVVLPSEASQIVKQRLVNFVRSLSTVLALAYCLSSVIQQAQKLFMETSDSSVTRNMGFEFAGKAVYTAVWVAAVSLFMELLGFSTQKWLTAGGLGTVLLTLAGREIFTNFLSSAMIHATRPFVVNEWIQTKIEGYEVSGTVEHVGWWSPTIIRGEDREAVHIPNHKFTVNVVRNLTQKTHWRIKTHLAISHLDVNKINNIVADMRKVLAKNPQVEHKKLHRRVFLDNINPENQALLILISCFVKTSHFEEYLCVKEAILLDLLRVISHHRARLATPIRTVQKIYSDADIDNLPFSDPVFTRGGAASNRPLLLIEPPYKINGEDRTAKARSTRTNGEQDGKPTAKPTPEGKADAKGGPTLTSDIKAKETPLSESKAKEADTKVGEVSNLDIKVDHITPTSILDAKADEKVNVNTSSKSASKIDSKLAEVSNSASKAPSQVSDYSTENISNKKPPKKVAPGNSTKEADTKVGEVSNLDIKVDHITSTSISDAKAGEKVNVNTSSKSASKIDSKLAEVSNSASKAPSPVSDNSTENISKKKLPMRVAPGNSSELASEKPGSFASTSQSKQEGERVSVPQPPISRPALEENIVLGVALEGSKRTLPIEEEMASPPAQAEGKELATSWNGNGSPTADNDKNHSQLPNAPSSTSGDQRQQRG